MSHLASAFFSTIVLLSAISCCRAEPKCDDAAVLESYAEAIKCNEIAQCASDMINGTSRDLAKMSDTELQQRALRSALNSSPPVSRELPHFDKMITFLAGVMSSSIAAWRDLFSTMKASATHVDYDPSNKRYTCQGRSSFDPALLSEAIRRYSLLVALVEPLTEMLVRKMISKNEDPTLILGELAKSTEAYLTKCFNPNRIFYVQSTTGSGFTVKLDENTLVPGCRTS